MGMKTCQVSIVYVFLAFALATPPFLIANTSKPSDSFDLTLFDLMNLEVDVASRTEETLSKSTGTVYSITQADIKRYGWRDLGEVLSSVAPSMLGQFHGHHWKVGSRYGRAGSSRSVILMDGRRLNPGSTSSWIFESFSAKNIERVDILMGPNSTLYSINALEMVVDITTKSGWRAQNDETVVALSSGIGEKTGGDVREYTFIHRKSFEMAEIGGYTTLFHAKYDFPAWQEY